MRKGNYYFEKRHVSEEEDLLYAVLFSVFGEEWIGRIMYPRSSERKRNRLAGYDYAQDGYYFVTICTQEHECYFGDVQDGQMWLNSIGKIVQEQWEWLGRRYSYIVLDEFVVMPNHLHGILAIDRSRLLNMDMTVAVGAAADTTDAIDSIAVIPTASVAMPGTKIGTNTVRNGRDHSLRNDELDGELRDEWAGVLPRRMEKIKPLPELMGAFKTTSSKHIHMAGLTTFHWQKSFYDHIVRYDSSLNRIREYIRSNPPFWEMDRNHKGNPFVG